MKFFNLFRFIQICPFAIIFTLSIFAQTPTPTPPIDDDDEVIKVQSKLIVVPVSVTDASGQPVLDLTAKDFFINEENRPQQIEQVSSAEKVPLEIVLLFDVSATVSPMFNFQLETAAKFLQEVMRPEDRASIFTIGERPLLIQTRDTAQNSIATIKLIQSTKQYTAFYDTVGDASEYLLKNAPVGRRKVILAISDGEDTNSVRIARAMQAGYRRLGRNIDTIDSKSLYEYTVRTRNEASLSEQRRVLQALQNADTVFYSINSAGSSYKLNKISVFGQSNMEKFANETGGTAYLPKFQPVDLKDNIQNSYNNTKNQEILTGIFRQLANELQAQYLVQYYSEADFPENRYVNLKVGLTNPRNLKVRARQGYFVKN